MATESLGLLVARVVADNEQFRSEFAKMRREVSGGTARINRSLSSIDARTQRAGRSMRQFTGIVTRFASIYAIGAMTRSIARTGVELQALERRFKFVAGTTEAAGKEFDFVRAEADRLGLSLQVAADSYTSLSAAAKGTEVSQETIRNLFVSTSEASRVLNLTADDTAGVFRALEQIISKGRVSAEELRQQLGERLPGAFNIAARAIGVTNEELDRMLRRGELTADELLPKLAEELRNTFGAEVAAASNDAAASFNRFQNSLFELRGAIASSGILDGLATLADLGTKIATGFGAAFGGKNPFPYENEIRSLEALREVLEGAPESGRSEDHREQIRATRQRLELLRYQQRVALGLQQPDPFVGPPVPGEQAAAAQGPAGVLSPLGTATKESASNLARYLEAKLEINEMLADAERNLTEEIEAQHRRRVTSAVKAAHDEARAQIDAQQQQLEFRSSVAQYSAQLLQGLFGQSKAIQLAAIAFEKLMAVRRIKIANLQAAELAFASQLIPGDPSSLLRAQAAKQAVLAQGRVAVAQAIALSVVSGLAEAAQVSRSSGGLGSFTNPIATTAGSSSAPGAVTGRRERSAVQIVFQGDVYGWDKFMRDRVVASLREVIDNEDIVVIGPGSRQAAAILGGG